MQLQGDLCIETKNRKPIFNNPLLDITHVKGIVMVEGISTEVGGCSKGNVVLAWKPVRLKKEKGLIQMKKLSVLTGAVAAMTIVSASNADITGCYYHGYEASAEDFGGTLVTAYVVDMYMTSNSSADALLNVYNANITNSLGDVTYYQGLTSDGWAPNLQGSIFDTADARYLDSFVSAGGRTGAGAESLDTDGNMIQMGDNGTGTDPNFGGNNVAAPGEDGGWYNGNPNNPIGVGFTNSNLPGALGSNLSIFIGRFSIEDSGEFDLSGALSVTWNEGIGTPGTQATFDIMEVPAPGALALLGVAGLASRRRRG